MKRKIRCRNMMNGRESRGKGDRRNAKPNAGQDIDWGRIHSYIADEVKKGITEMGKSGKTFAFNEKRADRLVVDEYIGRQDMHGFESISFKLKNWARGLYQAGLSAMEAVEGKEDHEVHEVIQREQDHQ